MTSSINQKFGLHRRSRTLMKVLIDAVGLSAAFWLSYLLRFDGLPDFQFIKQLIVLWPYVVACQLICLVVTGVSAYSWRYIGLRECQRIMVVFSVPSFLFLCVRLGAPLLEPVLPHAAYLMIPIGVICIDLCLGLAAVIGVRVLRRIIGERYEVGQRIPTRAAVRTILVGAGQGGLLIAREIENRPELALEAVGFLDDDPTKLGTIIHGLRVLGPIASAEELKDRFDVQQALITVSNIEGTKLREIVEKCNAAGLPAKIIPGLHEIVGGKARLSRIRDVRIEDLLRRKPVELDMQALTRFIQGESILVTGAGGSIGSELCRQITRFAPKALYMVERSENALFEIDRELRQMDLGDVELIPAMGDITDRRRVRDIIARARPSVIFHAAAHKHVPMVEANPAEAIKNNLGGTITLVDIAGELSVPNFVMISTDKAVNPTSMMGATKRGAELYIQSVSADYPATKFASVRFGNVLGSNGSVVPIFRKQIEKGGPITVTHPEMRRYFMTIPEASQLVMQAGALSKDGEIFILDMGSPVKIVDLAHDLIRLSGFELGRDIDIEFTGIRPGEKLFEELNAEPDKLTKTKHASIFVVPEASDDIPRTLGESLITLSKEAEDLERSELYASMREIIPEFQSTNPAVASDVSDSSNVVHITKFRA